jgi:hypothetical protein
MIQQIIHRRTSWEDIRFFTFRLINIGFSPKTSFALHGAALSQATTVQAGPSGGDTALHVCGTGH